MAVMSPSAWRELLLDPGVKKHLALAYRQETHLVRCVAAWAARALTTGGGAILVGSEEHIRGIAREMRLMGLDVDARVDAGRLVLLDAETTLGEFLDAGRPDAERFRSGIGGMVRAVREACGDPGADIRAWGEMVNLLHASSRPDVARALESLWDQFIAHENVRLLCSYDLSVVRDLADTCETHSAILIESEDVEVLATRVMEQVFGEDLPGPALTHVLRRGALPIGAPTPSALLLPLEGWARPARASRAL